MSQVVCVLWHSGVLLKGQGLGKLNCCEEDFVSLPPCLLEKGFTYKEVQSNKLFPAENKNKTLGKLSREDMFVRWMNNECEWIMHKH